MWDSVHRFVGYEKQCGSYDKITRLNNKMDAGVRVPTKLLELNEVKIMFDVVCARRRTAPSNIGKTHIS